MGDDSSRIVAEGYDRVADRYEALEREEWPRLRRLRELLALLPDGALVLDAGCGNGRPALAAIAERHAATGIDVSAVQAERVGACSRSETRAAVRASPARVSMPSAP